MDEKIEFHWKNWFHYENKAWQRLVLIRKPKEFRTSQNIQVYVSLIESTHLSNISVWFGHITQKKQAGQDSRNRRKGNRPATKVKHWMTFTVQLYIGRRWPSLVTLYTLSILSLSFSLQDDDTEYLWQTNLMNNELHYFAPVCIESILYTVCMGY